MSMSRIAPFLLVGLFAVLSPGQARGNQDQTASNAAVQGVVLQGGAEASTCWHLLVERGPGTLVDRGELGPLAPKEHLVGSFRYWEEPMGRVLYVYDALQNLVGRIVNPARVTLLGPAADVR